MQLTSGYYQRVSYSLIPNKITFRNSHIINIPYMPKWDPGKKYTAYDVSPPTNMVFTAKDLAADDDAA